MSCNNLRQVIDLQVSALKKSILASKKNGERKAIAGKKLDDEIQKIMLSDSFKAYGSGFKAVYCNFFCPKCESPYDLPVEDDYDLLNIRARMSQMGLLPLYAEIEPELRTEVSRHKYFISQQAGRDLGWETAERDYIDRHFKDFLEGTAACFVECGLMLKDKEQKR
jgi:hypothetical protein